MSAQDVRPPEAPGTDIMRAEAMAAYTRSLLEPLVAHVAELETTVRDQAETIGTLRADLATAQASISSLEARTAAQSVEPTPEPSGWRSWVSDHVSATVVGFIAILALVLGLVSVLH